MDQIIHPSTGENGFFCSTAEIDIIATILRDYDNKTLLLPRGDAE